eukprot:1023577-Alexandrium_andersonii.AAC.1
MEADHIVGDVASGVAHVDREGHVLVHQYGCKVEQAVHDEVHACARTGPEHAGGMNEAEALSIVKQLRDVQRRQLEDGELRWLLTDPAYMRLSQLYKQGALLGAENLPDGKQTSESAPIDSSGERSVERSVERSEG